LPSWQTPPERYAYVTGETSTQTQTKLADGSWRTTQTDTTIDSAYGTVSQVDDKGDIGPGKTGDDVCVRNSYTRNTNDLTLRAGTGGGLVSATGSSVSVDWSRYDIIITPGDFSGDGKADLLARNTLTGNIDMYTGNGAGGFATGPVEVGWAWTDMDFAFSPGDFSGDGKPDVLYRRISDNNLYMIKGNAAGGWIDGVSIAVGWGWTDMDRLFSIGDITGDGKTDVMFRRPSTGNLYYLAGNGASSWTGAITQIGTGPWTSADRFFGKGDVTGDGKADLYTRDTATGNLSLYPGTGAGGFGTPTAAGAGWGVYQHILTTGDVTSDGKADIFARYGGARNTATASKVETVGLNCGGTVTYPTDVISDVRTSYDGDGYQVPPMRGLITKTETAKSYSGGVANAFVTTSSGYDAYGRPVWTKDPRGNQTNTLYTHDSAGLLTQVKVTNPLAHEITTNYETLRGLPTSVTDANNKVTTGSYDPLGRTTKVVKPGNTTGFGDMEYLYSITKTSAPYVQTKALGPNGNQITSFEILDGFLRPRQTQVITETGKRTVTDNRYDDRGLAAKASVFYDGASAPTSTMVWPVNGDADIDQQTRYTYDGVGRQTSNELFSHNVSQFRTTTVYQGELTGVIPPLGGTVTQSVSDARGNTVEKRQYQSPTALTGLFDATSYTYDHAGRLTGVTDAGNNTWNYSYDLLGRKYQTVDPDAGTSTSAFDDAGNVTSTTDARGRTLFYEYDALNRKTLERADTVTGVIQADWVYDSVAKGQLTSTSRYIGTNTYTSSIGSYDNGYRPLVATDSVPGFGAAGGTLAYSVTNTYKTNGALDTQQLPGVGGLPGETITHTYKATTGLPDRITSDANGGTTYVDSTNYLFDGLVSDSTFGASSGNQVKVSATYDLATRRLATSSFSTKTAGTWTNDRYSDTYGFDNAGNVKSIAGTKGRCRRTGTVLHLRLPASPARGVDADARCMLGPADRGRSVPPDLGLRHRRQSCDPAGCRCDQQRLGLCRRRNLGLLDRGEAAPAKASDRHRAEGRHRDPRFLLRRGWQHHQTHYRDRHGAGPYLGHRGPSPNGDAVW
jgi:YD repeat-containing protein